MAWVTPQQWRRGVFIHRKLFSFIVCVPSPFFHHHQEGGGSAPTVTTPNVSFDTMRLFPPPVAWPDLMEKRMGMKVANNILTHPWRRLKIMRSMTSWRPVRKVDFLRVREHLLRPPHFVVFAGINYDQLLKDKGRRLLTHLIHPRVDAMRCIEVR